MRKLIIVLTILVLAIGMVFAEEPHTIRLKSVVDDERTSIDEANAISPKGLFVLTVTGVMDNNDTEGEKLLMSDYDIAEHDIDIEFSVVQTERVQTIGRINLTATVGSLMLDTDSSKAVEASATGSWTTAKGLSNYEDAITVTTATADNVVSIEIRYLDDTKEVPAQPIGTFVAKWARSPELVASPGLYKASVTLSYTVD